MTIVTLEVLVKDTTGGKLAHVLPQFFLIQCMCASVRGTQF
jgi:hypothetical protein